MGTSTKEEGLWAFLTSDSQAAPIYLMFAGMLVGLIFFIPIAIHASLTDPRFGTIAVPGTNGVYMTCEGTTLTFSAERSYTGPVPASEPDSPKCIR
jgi:hypothetical protein